MAMTTQELQQMFIERCHKAEACITEFKALKQSIGNPIHFARVLLHNHSWCVDKGIYTAAELLMFEPEILHKAGLALPKYTPVDFERTTSIGGLDWMPFNEGATAENLYGDYLDFDTTAALSFDDRRVPSTIEHRLLAAAPHQFGVYGNKFGWVLTGDDNNLFLPAAGCRGYYYGQFHAVGYDCVVWSSSPSTAADGSSLSFYYNGYLRTSNSSYRSFGLSVRLVKSNE